MVGMAIVMGQVTSYVEQHSGGASGEEFNLGFLDRVLISGRSFWFYLGKIVFPYRLTFIYPRWQIDGGVWWQYVYPAGAIGLLWGLWGMRRRIGKGPFCGGAAFLRRHVVSDIDAGALYDALLVRVGSLAVLWLHECSCAGGGWDHESVGSSNRRPDIRHVEGRGPRVGVAPLDIRHSSLRSGARGEGEPVAEAGCLRGAAADAGGAGLETKPDVWRH